MHEIELLSAISAAALKGDMGAEPYRDALTPLTTLAETESVAECAWSRWLRDLCLAQVSDMGAKIAHAEPAEAERLAHIADEMLRAAEAMCELDATRDLDSYILFMEWGRPAGKRFWLPRRRVLYPLARDMQDLSDDRLDFLAISLPPRVGKSTLAIFFLTWLMGRHPTKANVMSGHSDKLTLQFYIEALQIISDNVTYRFALVFPESPLVGTSARDEAISLKRKGRFPTLTCRSVDGTLTGAVEVGRGALLYCDDLVSDREQALSPERMDKLYSAYLNQLKDRKLAGAKELHVGTRWAPNDVIGRILTEHADNPRYRFTTIPALNEAGESNFDYGEGHAFPTSYYEDMRRSLIEAGEKDAWLAKYMGEPIWVGGRLFENDELRWYDGELPEGEPDAIVAVCDTKDQGKDYAAMPVAYVYGRDFYIHDAVCDNGKPDAVEPKLVATLVNNRVGLARFESNAAGGRIADDVSRACADAGLAIDLRKKFSTTNKETRILNDSMWVKERCIFRSDKPTPDYARFIDQLCGYSTEGKNPHDDAPDAMSMLKRLMDDTTTAKVEAVRRLV